MCPDQTKQLPDPGLKILKHASRTLLPTNQVNKFCQRARENKILVSSHCTQIMKHTLIVIDTAHNKLKCLSIQKAKSTKSYFIIGNIIKDIYY